MQRPTTLIERAYRTQRGLSHALISPNESTNLRVSVWLSMPGSLLTSG